MKKIVNVTGIVLAVIAICLTLGFAAFVDSLGISEAVVKIRPEINTRISSATTNSGYISNLDYTMKEITSVANIPNNESVTFSTTITTYSNVPTALSEITVLNGNNVLSNVTVTPDLTSTYIRICDNNNNCVIGASKDVAITVTNNTGSTISSNNFKVVLTFTPFYKITYNSVVVGDVLSGGTFAYTVANNITNVTKDSGTGTLDTTSLPDITISDVLSDIVLTGTSGPIQDGSWAHPYLHSDSTYHYSDLSVGSHKFTALTGEPEITVDANHQVTKYEFTNTGANGITFTTGDSMDTGVLAFDGVGFTIHLEMEMTPTGQTGKYMLSAIKQLENQNNKYGGFVFWCYSTSYFYLNASTSANLNATSFGSRAAYWRINNSTQPYEFEITFTPTPNKSVVASLDNVASGSTTPSISANLFPDTLSGATITIGGNGMDTSKDIVSMTVTKFWITKN